MRSCAVPLLLSLAACRGAPASVPTHADEATTGEAQSAGPVSGAIPSESTATLRVGDRAPAFSLVAEDGASFDLEAASAAGPVVLVFYRGDW